MTGPPLDVRCRGRALVAALPGPWPCLSSGVLGGGLARLRTWLNLQVPGDYARTDPAAHLAEEAARRGLSGPVVGMLTAADVTAFEVAREGSAVVVATVGLGHPLAAAATRPRAVAAPPGPGTINLLAVTSAPLAPAGLVDAVAACVAARAQTLAEARVRAGNAAGAATGTATDSVCVATRSLDGAAFAGPATVAGADLARAVRAALRETAALRLAGRVDRATSP